MAKFKFTGARNMDAALASLPKATRRATALRILRRAAKPMADDMEEHAPERTGKLKRGVSVSTKAKNKPTGRRGVTVFVGPGPLKRARLQELGTAHSAPQPFVRPAWDRNHRKAMHDIAEATEIEITKALGRRARKINRAAARAKKGK